MKWTDIKDSKPPLLEAVLVACTDDLYDSYYTHHIAWRARDYYSNKGSTWVEQAGDTDFNPKQVKFWTYIKGPK